MKPLPMSLWLALEDDVNRHKAELAQAFAEARARLLPPKPFEYHTVMALVAGI